MNRWCLVVVFAPVAMQLSGCGGDGESCLGVCKVCGSGDKVTKSMTFAPYGKISVNSGITAQISVGPQSSFSVTLFNNIVDYLDVKVESDTLVVKLKDGVCNSGVRATIAVTEKQLTSVGANGASTVTVETVIGGPISATGASHVIAETVKGGPISATGASHVTLKTLNGNDVQSAIMADGASQVIVKNAVAAKVKVGANGASKVDLKTLVATTQADVSATGSSSVSISDVATLKLQVSGASHVVAVVRDKAYGSCSGGGSVKITGGGDASGVTTFGGCSLSDLRNASLSMTMSV